MSTKTITITEDAYNRLKSRKGENESFSQVIVKYFPVKRKLSEVLAEIGRDDELADSIDLNSAACATYNFPNRSYPCQCIGYFSY